MALFAFSTIYLAVVVAALRVIAHRSAFAGRIAGTPGFRIVEVLSAAAMLLLALGGLLGGFFDEDNGATFVERADHVLARWSWDLRHWSLGLVLDLLLPSALLALAAFALFERPAPARSRFLWARGLLAALVFAVASFMLMVFVAELSNASGEPLGNIYH